jgi:hypothetical protein
LASSRLFSLGRSFKSSCVAEVLPFSMPQTLRI